MKYTVLMLHYNQQDRLQGIIDTWNKQTIPPEKILVLDDGSDDAPASRDSNVEIVRLPHTMNVGKNINVGYDMVETGYYVVTSADLFCNPEFAERSMKLLRDELPPMSVPVGQFIKTSTLDPCQDKKPTRVGGRTVEFRKNGMKVKFPVGEGWMRRTSECLYYSEDYTGWGFEDTDYMARFKLAGGKFFGYNYLRLFHLDHDPNWNNDGWREKPNKDLYFKNVERYKKEGITKLR